MPLTPRPGYRPSGATFFSLPRMAQAPHAVRDRSAAWRSRSSVCLPCERRAPCGAPVRRFFARGPCFRMPATRRRREAIEGLCRDRGRGSPPPKPAPRPATKGGGAYVTPRTAAWGVPVPRLQAARASAGPAPHASMSADTPLMARDSMEYSPISKTVKQLFSTTQGAGAHLELRARLQLAVLVAVTDAEIEILADRRSA